MLATEAHVGVSIFFTLSGFLIANRYAFGQKEFKLGRYLLNRFAKVYPLYFVLSTLTFLRLKVGGWDLYFYNISLLRGFFDDLKFTGIAQGWTLTVEECFYLLAPLIFFTITRNKAWWFVWPILFLLIGWCYTLLPSGYHPMGLLSPFSFMVGNTIFGRLFEFMAGLGLAWIWEKRKVGRLNHFKYFTYGGLVLFAGVYGWMVSLQSGQGTFGQEHPWGMVLNNLILPITTSIIIYGLITESTFISRWLSARWMWWMGSASYAFYLIHMGIFHDAIVTFITWNWWARFLGLNLLAVFAFVLFEYPVQQLIKNYQGQIGIAKNIKTAIKSTLKMVKSRI